MSSKARDEPVVHAAGGIVHRRVRRGIRARDEVAVVHRPRYDDWTFPKGKRDDGESDEETALREVHEETGLRCTLGAPAGETRYRDNKGRQKVVRYWWMQPASGGVPFVPNQEVDEVAWLAPREAGRLLTYEHDRELLRRLATGRRIGRKGIGGKERSSARLRLAPREGR